MMTFKDTGQMKTYITDFYNLLDFFLLYFK